MSRTIRAVGTVEASAARLLNIAHDLLDMTRIETGHLELVLQTVDLLTLANQVIAELSTQLDARTQPLALHAPASLPAVLCDPLWVAQIMGNLVNNASKYSPPGSPISLNLAVSDEPGFMQVSVADQGVGIPDQERARIFDPFFRASTSARMNANGTGLGLAIARALVELHGGRIWFDSAPGTGTVFQFTLPLVACPTPPHR